MTDRTSYSFKINRKEEMPADAVVLHCSDHRFQRSFHEFLIEELKVGLYALLSIPGGGHFLSMEDVMSKYFKISLRSLSFHINRNKPRRAIVIGHYDCLFFKEQAQFYFSEPGLNQKQFANLRKARIQLQERFPGLEVELYFADVKEDGSVEFLRVE